MKQNDRSFQCKRTVQGIRQAGVLNMSIRAKKRNFLFHDSESAFLEYLCSLHIFLSAIFGIFGKFRIDIDI